MIGYVLFGIALLFGPLLGGTLIYEAILGDQTLAFSPKEDILYGRNVPVEEARALSLALQGQGFFDGASEKTVLLHHEGDEYVVGVILRSGFEDAKMHDYFQTLAMRISGARQARSRGAM
jgi:hypothetical protein